MSEAALAQITKPPNHTNQKAEPLAEQNFQALLSIADGAAQRGEASDSFPSIYSD